MGSYWGTGTLLNYHRVLMSTLNGPLVILILTVADVRENMGKPAGTKHGKETDTGFI